MGLTTVGRGVIPALTAANFVVGFSVLIVPGMLTNLASAFSVSIPVAGQLITAGSIVMGVGAPVSAALTSQIDRRALLLGALWLFALGHLICAMSDNFTVLLVVRSITVLSAAIITPQAAATLGLLVAPERRGAALASIFVGWSLASVVAMPTSNLLAKALGWQAPFFLASGLSLAMIVWLSLALPKGLVLPKLSLQAWISVARHPILIPVLAVTLVSFASQFVVFSFMVPILEKGHVVSPLWIAALLFFYGLMGVLGNAFSVRILPAIGPNRFVTYALLAIAAAQIFWGLAFQSGVYFYLPLVLAMGIWGAASFASNSAQQGRLMAADPSLASASIALNSSCLYLGQAIGTPIGAALIAVYGYAALPWVALVFMLLAILVSQLAARRAEHTVR